MIEELRSMLIRHEGIRFKPYRDTVGKLTIGVGHNLDDKPISRNAVDQILNDDISDAQQALYAVLPWMHTLDLVRQDVLIDLAFNIGAGGVLGFRNMLSALQAGNWDLAADEMLNSKWASQVGNRAIELSTMMRNGEYVGQ